MSDNLNILEINEADFEEKVLKDSSSSLVLVDFWHRGVDPANS